MAPCIPQQVLGLASNHTEEDSHYNVKMHITVNISVRRIEMHTMTNISVRMIVVDDYLGFTTSRGIKP